VIFNEEDTDGRATVTVDLRGASSTCKLNR